MCPYRERVVKKETLGCIDATRETTMVKETNQGWFCSSQSSFGAAKIRLPPGEDILPQVSKFDLHALFFLFFETGRGCCKPFMTKSCPTRRGSKEAVEENESQDVGSTRWGERLLHLTCLYSGCGTCCVCLEVECAYSRRKRARFLRPE